jgi:hypothetical protein
LACGLLIFLLKNFGIIYSLAYLQLLITLCTIEYCDDEKRAQLLRAIFTYGKRCYISLMIMAVAYLGSYLLFRNEEFGNYSGYYQKIGIGFIQIARNSFYWYVPVLFSMVFILLLKARNRVTSTYVATGFLLLYCAIGNSIYFFGRSHEHNIINISLVLLFLFFFMLDLIARFLDKEDVNASTLFFLKKHVVSFVAIALIVVIIVSYSENITKGVTAQFRNAYDSKISRPSFVLPINFTGYMARIREVTNGSSKVFFVDSDDFIFYYYGGYAPVGYCNPFLTCIFTKDLKSHLQKLLDNGYYLVVNPDMKDQISELHYDFNAKLDDSDTIVIAMLPKTTTR